MSDDGITRRDALRNVAAATTTLGVVGSASAKESGLKKLSVSTVSARKSLAEQALPLLETLAADGLIRDPSPDVFPSHLMTDDYAGGIGRYLDSESDNPQTVFILYNEAGKITVNLPDDGNPFAVYSPDDGTTKILYNPTDKSGTTYEQVDTDLSTSYCGGCVCTSAPLCVLKNFRKTACENWEDGECITTSSCGC